MSTDDRTDDRAPDDRAPDDEATSRIDVPLEDTMTTPTISGEPSEQTTATMPTTPALPAMAATATTAPAVPAAPSDAAPGRRQPRVGTIVWGLVIAAIGAFILAYALGVEFDEQLAGIVVIAAAGVLLLAGSLLSTRRRRP